ncbi:MAG: HAD-IIA family hydrolase [Candidatus Rokubacteria bacterium]|nr:HAD-IIA family hydrolase [Candidatus Rokubacteria bacterium]
MRLGELRGFVFDLDGCIWAGSVLLPGVKEFLACLRQRGKRLLFLTNNSRELPESLATRLNRLGVEASSREVLTALELLGKAISQRFGRTDVLAVGAGAMGQVLEAEGHRVVPVERWKEARVVAVGNDPTFDYVKLKAAAQAVARGAGFVTVNLDPRLPLEEGEFDPGAGAIAEAVAVASGVRPLVIGKPNPVIFKAALERLGCEPHEAAMVGDSLNTDIRGGAEAGMVTVWLAAADAKADSAFHPRLRVASFPELLARLDDELR